MLKGGSTERRSGQAWRGYGRKSSNCTCDHIRHGKVEGSQASWEGLGAWRECLGGRGLSRIRAREAGLGWKMSGLPGASCEMHPVEGWVMDLRLGCKPGLGTERVRQRERAPQAQCRLPSCLPLEAPGP